MWCIMGIFNERKTDYRGRPAKVEQRGSEAASHPADGHDGSKWIKNLIDYCLLQPTQNVENYFVIQAWCIFSSTGT